MEFIKNRIEQVFTQYPRCIGYSFTFTIPGDKRIYYMGKKRIYNKMSHQHQAKFMNDHIIDCMSILEEPLFFDYVFEHHTKEDDRLHIHGYVLLQEDNIQYMNSLRTLFYKYAFRINIASNVHCRLSDIQKTIVDKKYWIDYISKHQHTIIYHSPYIEEKGIIEEIDKGIVKIQMNIDQQRPPDYYNKYRFQGTQNNFFVEI